MADRLCLGVITGARGLRGELWIKSFTGDAAGIGDYGALTDESGARSFEVTVKDVVKGKVLALVKGVRDRTEADRLKGVKLYVERAELPALDEEEYYYADLIGLTVELVTGETLGTVKAVHDFGAGDVIDVAGEGRKGLMVPFTRAAVPVVDVKGGRVVVDPPPGLLEDADPDTDETDGGETR